MKFELIIDSKPNEVVIALLKNDLLIELHKEKRDNNYSVGDILLGRIKKIIPGLNAAFVDVGHEKDGFLHYLDLGPQINSYTKYTQKCFDKKLNTSSLKNFKKEKDIEKEGKISDIIKQNQKVLVQITKEPISTKGPRLTTEISLAGRFMVLIPFSNRVSVSQKISSSSEKKRLKKLITSIRPEGFGVIIRTVAENKKVAELDKDLKNLYKKWQHVTKKLKVAQSRETILSEINRSAVIVRDLLNSKFNNIYVNDKDLHLELKEYLSSISPDQEKIVKLYKGKSPIFQKFNITKQIKSSFGKNVTIKNGTYLVIEHTEAMHVIDVNSGKKVDSKKNQEANALSVNLEAAEEIARQLRLRDMGGIIIVDFIDLQSEKNKRTLFQKMKEFMEDDKAKHHILPPTKFGLIQITRQRVRPVMHIDTQENCPVCNGNPLCNKKGKIESSLQLIDKIENKVLELTKEIKGEIKIATHPFICSHINKGWFFSSIKSKWQRKYSRKIIVSSDDRLHLLQYSVLKN